MSHSNIFTLTQKIQLAQKIVKKGASYYHYKTPNKYYKVIDIALQESNENPCVIYHSLDNPEIIWVRDLEVWCQQVLNDNNEYVDRFSEV